MQALEARDAVTMNCPTRQANPNIPKTSHFMYPLSSITETDAIAATLSLSEFEQKLNNALTHSMDWCMPEDASRQVSNALRSSHFCFTAGECIRQLTTASGRLRHMRFNGTDIKREPGEWLLDAVVAECHIDSKGSEGVVSKIHVAMECESSTALKEFFTDFSKLLHIKSDTKIYMQGLNQRDEPSARSFIAKRLEMAAKYVREIDSAPTWYFGFWPSPLALDIEADDRSLWAELKRGKHEHLRRIKLYKFDGSQFTDQN